MFETEEVGTILSDGTVIKGETNNGLCYKNPQAFKNKEDICYVPELNDYGYTYEDFLEEANNNESIAEMLFETVDWQSPEACYNDMLNSNEIAECSKCDNTYVTEGKENCPCAFCGHMEE